MKRRTFIASIVAAIASLPLLPQNLLAGISAARNNFKQIYASTRLKDEFFKFSKTYSA